ncbi:MAG: bifunctional phosphopantothenoylcysteine decarboxylase/phosphopantothenate synthase, partial [Hyphomicrobiales bacterium]
AAVADWRVADVSGAKIKKAPGEGPPPLQLTENPDILKTVGHHPQRPRLVVGFAAETDDTVENGRLKLARKGADFIVANDVSTSSGVEGGVMGGTRNRVTVIGRDSEESWPELDKDMVAEKLAGLIASRLD